MGAAKERLSKNLIIDGHNLIPKIAGMSLEDPDDEQRLIERLRAYAARRGKTIDVFFDKAAPGQAGDRARGVIRAHFVPPPQIADEAIRLYVKRLGAAAKNVTVISSDHRVQMEVKRLGAQAVDSEVFAAEMAAAAAESAASGAQPPADDLDIFIEMFGLNPDQADQPIPLGKKEKTPKKPPAPAAPPKKRARHGFEKKQ